MNPNSMGLITAASAPLSLHPIYNLYKTRGSIYIPNHNSTQPSHANRYKPSTSRTYEDIISQRTPTVKNKQWLRVSFRFVCCGFMADIAMIQLQRPWGIIMECRIDEGIW
jgi:hypothetical protein